jgi:hypothetical protein
MKNTIVVIEPHADDAYLSLHQHMVDWIKEGKKVVIATVFSGTRKRAKDAAAYAAAIGAEWAGFELTEGLEVSPLDSVEFGLPGHLGMLYGLGDVTIVSPLGIQHPEHKAVRAWIRAGNPEGSEFCYVEIPYYLKLKNQVEVNFLLQNLIMVSLRKPKHYKADEKYWKCFKDQAKFFHFNPPEGYKDIPEMIVRVE